MQSGEYYCGSGISTNLDQARDHALAELTRQIAVQVASSFERVIQEHDSKYQEKVENIIKTHSLATLENVEERVEMLSGYRFDVFCYLEKSNVERIFAERKRLIAEIATRADDLAKELNLANALKYYYFATILINSLPDQNVDYNGVHYTSEIPSRIHKILTSLSFRFQSAKEISDQEREVTLTVMSSGKPVATLDFTFWNGSTDEKVSSRDGLATFHLFGGSTKFTEIKARPRYDYYESRTEYQPVATLWELVIKPEFINAPHTVPLSHAGHVAPPPPPFQKLSIEEKQTAGSEVVKTLIKTTATGDFNVKLDFEEDIPAAPVILVETQRFLKAINAIDAMTARSAYQSDVFMADKIADYVRNNRPRPLDQNLEAALTKTTIGWELRSIRVLHRYPTLHRQSTEYLTLDFTPEGKLCDFNACITENLYQNFVKAAAFGDDWGNRQQIIKFIEKYRTAYLTRDLPTVDLMFAEEAIIIIGRKLERRKLADQAVQYEKMGKQPDFEYIQLNKKQYLERQRQIFAANQDIALDFSTFNIVKKNDRDSVYGVEMRQNYASTAYADEGYLFLLIDFREKDPLIYIRAWQPNAWNPDELIKTGNFKIHK